HRPGESNRSGVAHYQRRYTAERLHNTRRSKIPARFLDVPAHHQDEVRLTKAVGSEEYKTLNEARTRTALCLPRIANTSQGAVRRRGSRRGDCFGRPGFRIG